MLPKGQFEHIPVLNYQMIKVHQCAVFDYIQFRGRDFIYWILSMPDTNLEIESIIYHFLRALFL